MCKCGNSKKNHCNLKKCEPRINQPLFVDRDNTFGVPIIIGTPAPGPEHGVGSYWYQIGQISGKEQAKLRLATLVNIYLTAAGRLAEFRGPAFVAQDTLWRRRTYTDDQWQEQLDTLSGNGSLNLEVLDLFNGIHQGYLDHILDIQNNLAPLPAEFVPGVGVLSNFNLFTHASSLFTLVNLCNTYYSTFVYNFGEAGDFSNQLSLLNNLITSVANDPSGGVNANQIFNDYYGIDGVTNNRFTIAEGDITKPDCATKIRSVYCSSNSGNVSQNRNISQYRNIEIENNSREVEIGWEEALEKALEDVKNADPVSFEPKNMSGDIPISPKISKCGTVMLFGNSQVAPTYGKIFAFPCLNFITPRASVFNPQVSDIFSSSVRSGNTDYNIRFAVEVHVRRKSDFVIEEKDNLVLIYDSSTNTENVPGGKLHSTIKVFGNPDTVITIYQGTIRKSLESGTRIVNSGSEKIVMLRNPSYWMRDVLFMNFIAKLGGCIPMNNFSDYRKQSQKYDCGQILVIQPAIDTNGNIYVIESASTCSLPIDLIVDGNKIDRMLFQDATNGSVFTNLVKRPLPVPTDNQYFIQTPRYVKNSPCGYFTSWNTAFTNSDPSATLRRAEINRTGWDRFYMEKLIAEKGKIDFEDVQELWRHRAVSGLITVTGQPSNLNANFWQDIWGAQMLTALTNQGLNAGLTQVEINNVLSLLDVNTFEGARSLARDQTEFQEGKDYDGRWVLAEIWFAEMATNLIKAAIPVGAFQTNVGTNLLLRGAWNLIPTADWSLSSTATSRVIPTLNNSTILISPVLRALNLGPQINTNQFAWNSLAGLTTQTDIELFIAKALKGALERQILGTNAGTGLDNGLGRANTFLIKPDGEPLHPGWGRNQMTFYNVSTTLLNTNFVVNANVKGQNQQGSLQFHEIKPKTKCENSKSIHSQYTSAVGVSSLMTVTVVNGQNVFSIDPHSFDQQKYFTGAYDLPEQKFC